MLALATSPPRAKRPHGHWAAFKEALEAMEPHDLLVWDVAREDRHYTSNRMTDVGSDRFVLRANWFDGKLFVVRVK